MREVTSENEHDASQSQSKHPKVLGKADFRTLWGYFDHEIKWVNVIYFIIVHTYGFKILLSWIPHKWYFLLWVIGYGSFEGFGLTAGAHRYFTHRSFEAKMPLRILLMLLFTSTGQNNLYQWVRDHRIHHKFSDTDADPHSAKRGLFFSHIGWLMLKRHPDVIKNGKKIDMSDLLADPVIRFHLKYITHLRIFCFSLSIGLPLLIMNWDFMDCVEITVFKLILMYNLIWMVNSVAHKWGSRPYNRSIRPVQSKFVSFCVLGEGWHNYHHTFPWDYKGSELFAFNITTFWIHFFAKIGWAYDLKEPSAELVEKVIRERGDGSHSGDMEVRRN